MPDTPDCVNTPEAAMNALITCAVSVAETDDDTFLDITRYSDPDYVMLSCCAGGVVVWRVVVARTWAGRRSAHLPGVIRSGIKIAAQPLRAGGVSQTYAPRKDGTYNLPAMQAKFLEAVCASRVALDEQNARQQTFNRREERLRSVLERHGLSRIDDRRRYYVTLDGRLTVRLRLDKPNALGEFSFPVYITAETLEPEQFDVL